MTVLLIEPGKTPRHMEIDGTLERMQQVVGGYIQAIYPFVDPVALVCNEEGKLMGMPFNRALIDDEGKIYDVVAGTFFVCSAPPNEEQFENLTPEQLAYYESLFRSPENFLWVSEIPL